MFFSESFVFVISTILAIILMYFRVSTNTFQQIIALLLAVLLIFSSRVVFSKSKGPKETKNKKNHYLLLLISAFLIQSLVVSTGGFYSPFLIVLHLYTLGSSFLLISKSSISFLVCSIGLLIANILLNPQMLTLFKEDPGPVVLYFISFVVIIPLAQFLMYSYHIKDALAKVLKEYVQIGEKREESILQGLNELVIVTNRDLIVLSVNEAAGKAVGLTETQIIRSPMLGILPLCDEKGKPVDTNLLSLDKLLSDKATRIVKDLFLKTKTDPRPRRVTLQARPICNSAGEINQIVFIINDALISDSLQRHADLKEAQMKYETMVNSLKKSIFQSKPEENLAIIELINKTEDDLVTAFEIEDHLIKKITSFEDAAQIGKQCITARQEFAKSLGVTLQFVLPKEETAEAALLNLTASNFPKEALPASTFTVPVDGKKLEIVVKKLLDIAILLTAGQKNPQVQLTVNKQTDKTVELVIASPSPLINQVQQQELFTQYFGSLGLTTNLKLGSGLEGFIAKSISSQLSIPIDVRASSSPQTLTFILTLNKAMEPNIDNIT